MAPCAQSLASILGAETSDSHDLQEPAGSCSLLFSRILYPYVSPDATPHAVGSVMCTSVHVVYQSSVVYGD